MKYFPQLFIVLVSFICCTQKNQQQSTEQPNEIEDLSIYDSIEGELIKIMTEMLEVISGEKEKIRDFDSFRNFFTEDATLSATVENKELGAMEERSLTVEEFIDQNKAFYEKNDFWEIPKDHEILKYEENIATADQLYEIFLADPASAKPVVIGVNTYEIVKENNEWRIASISYRAYKDLSELPEYFQQEVKEEE